MLNQISVEQLLTWSRDPGLLPRVLAGLARGKAWSKLDIDTLQGLTSGRDIDIAFTAATELRRRGLLKDKVAKRPGQGLLP